MASLSGYDRGVRVAGGGVAGVAIGLVVAAVAVFYAEVINPFPVSLARSRRTVNVMFRNRTTGRESPLNQPSVELLATSQTEFESLGAALPIDVKDVARGDVTPLEFVNADFFRVLDVKPAVGRLPVPASAGGVPEVLVSPRFFNDRLGGDASALGRIMAFEPCQFAVVGVATGDLARWRRRAELWGRIEDLRACGSEDILGPGYFGTSVVGLLHAGTDASQVAPALQARLTNSLRESGETALEISVQRAAAALHAPATQAGLAVFLMGALAACAAAFVSSVSLQTSAIERHRSAWVVRRTLGATRGALARLVALDSLGGLAAALLAAGGTLGLGARQLDTLGLTVPSRRWLVVATITVVALVGTAVAAGLARLLSYPLAEGARDTRIVGDAARGQVRLLGGQVAFATLIAGLAVLCWTSVHRLETVDIGSRLENVQVVPLSWDAALPRGLTSTATAMADLEVRLGDRLKRAVGIGTDVPFMGTHSRTSIWFPDGTKRLSGQSVDVPGVHAVSSGYLAAIGARLVEGRHLTTADGPSGEPVAIVSAAAARAFWPGRSALEQMFKLRLSGRWIRVVGVVADMRYASVGAPARPEIFLTYDQLPWRRAALVLGPTTENAAPTDAELLRIISSVAGTLPGGVQSGRSILANQYGLARLLASAASLVAAGMLVVCAAATLAIAAYLIAQRRAEIGLRLALGGTAGRVAREILRGPAKAAAAGIVLGLLLSVPLGMWLRSTLYGVASLDVTLTGAIGGAVCAMAWLGGLWATLPRLREIEPATLLRAL